MLEPCEAKVSRTVLRGLGLCEGARLLGTIVELRLEWIWLDDGEKALASNKVAPFERLEIGCVDLFVSQSRLRFHRCRPPRRDQSRYTCSRRQRQDRAYEHTGIGAAYFVQQVLHKAHA